MVTTARRRPAESFYAYVLTSERWARLRQRIIRERGRRCERCGVPQAVADLDLHHLTYERLGRELDSDVEVLCRRCHRKADRRRKAARRPPAQVIRPGRGATEAATP